MKFTISFVLSILLSSISGNSAEAKHYHLQGIAAEKVFKTFINAYASNNSKTVLRSIPLHGGIYQIMRSMIFVKAMQQIDPNGIDALVKNYDLTSYSFRCKQLFLLLLSEMSVVNRLTVISVSVSTDERGYIQWLEAKTHKNRNGVMRLGKHYFKEYPLHISSLEMRGLEEKQ